MLPDLEFLTSRESIGYGPRPIPCAFDAAVERIVVWYQQADGLGRAALRAGITPRAASTLSAYAERAASLAVRRKEADVLRGGLLAAAIGWYYEDPRESLLILPLFYDAATRLRLDAQVLFDEAATAVDDAPGPGLRDFPQRSPEDRALTAMGYREGADAGGFRYVRRW